MDTLIVFSHLRWNFVYQRPQHLMVRMARQLRVLFVEEPVVADGTARLVKSDPLSNLTICTPHTPCPSPGFHDDQLPALQQLLADLVVEQSIVAPLVWLYTPMALPLVAALRPSGIIYDCMDELSAFKNAPTQLLEREGDLYSAADLVFTGGPSLYRAKKHRHRSVHCFPSSVDRAHFECARDPSLDHPAQLAIPHPRLGFFGVIDERLDLDLVDSMAASHPEWNLVLVGPVVKIDANTLPRRANIHYFGERSYLELPQFLAGWDVCILPFALNEATRFISPTKTLEFMAAEKPIVSTPVEDVAAPYGEVIGIGEGAQFIALCEQALREVPSERARRVNLMQKIVAGTSWDKTASEMLNLIDAVVHVVSDSHDVVVIGAGPTGLSAAYHLGEDCLLLEQASAIGGWCRSIEDKGFTFDCAGHIMFSNDPYVKELYKILLGENVHWQNREAWIFSKNVYTRYPFQGALYGLPPDVITECIVGAVEARMGTADEQKTRSVALANPGSSTTACKAESITDGEDLLPSGVANAAESTPRNFEEFIYQVWGKGIAKHFALPYNRKLWAVPLATMETSWLGGRVPLPDLSEMIEGALRPVMKPVGPNARFGYPLRGGFQALMNGFLGRLRGTLKLNACVAQVHPSRHIAVLSDGTVHHYEKLISTVPLPVLVKMTGEEAPARVRRAASQLRHVSVRCVNLGIGRERITEKHWIYYPEATLFHRIFVQGNASPFCNPAGGFGLTCEITYSPDKPLPLEGDALIDRCIEDAIGVGIINADDEIIARNMVDMPYAYVIYDHGRAENVATIRQWADSHDIILAGRYSEWEYYNSDHAFIAGRNAALTAQIVESDPASQTSSAKGASSPGSAKALSTAV